MKKLDDDMIIYDNGAEPVAENAPKKITGKDIIARVVCLFAAFLIWIYVMNVDSTDREEVFRSVGVSLENASVLKNEYDMSVISGTGNVADVTIKGKKNIMSRYSAEDIKVYVDLSGISETGRHTLDVRAEIPEGVMLVDITPSTIEVYVDNDTTKTVRVIAKATSYTLDASCELGELVPEVSEIIVRGPEKKLEMIDHALVEFDLGAVGESLISRGVLKLVDATGSVIDDPYLKMSTNTVQVNVPVYTYKDVPLTAEYKYGFFNESNADITITPATIRLKGDPKALESVNEISVVTVDEKKISGDYHQDVQIFLPSGITNVSGETSAAISIKHKNTGVKVLAISEFEVKNPKGLTYEMADSLNVVLRAPTTLLSHITPEYITVGIDLSYIGAVSGIVSVPVTITVDPVVEGKVYEIGDYRIQLEITE